MGRIVRSANTEAPEGGLSGRTLVRAQRLAAAGEHMEALSLFREIVEGGPTRDRQAACVGAGNALLALRRYELAEGCYEQSATLGADPDLFAESLQNLGISRYVRGDRTGACDVMQELAVLDHPVFSPLAQDNLQVLFGLVIY